MISLHTVLYFSFGLCSSLLAVIVVLITFRFSIRSSYENQFDLYLPIISILLCFCIYQLLTSYYESFKNRRIVKLLIEEQKAALATVDELLHQEVADKPQ